MQLYPCRGMTAGTCAFRWLTVGTRTSRTNRSSSRMLVFNAAQPSYPSTPCNPPFPVYRVRNGFKGSRRHHFGRACAALAVVRTRKPSGGWSACIDRKLSSGIQMHAGIVVFDDPYVFTHAYSPGFLLQEFPPKKRQSPSSSRASARGRCYTSFAPPANF